MPARASHKTPVTSIRAPAKRLPTGRRAYILQSVPCLVSDSADPIIPRPRGLRRAQPGGS